MVGVNHFACNDQFDGPLLSLGNKMGRTVSYHLLLCFLIGQDKSFNGLSFVVTSKSGIFDFHFHGIRCIALGWIFSDDLLP